MGKKTKNKIYLGLDISTQCIGVTILEDDGSEFGKVLELTHINPKVSNKIDQTEQLFLKKRIFETFIKKYKKIGITNVVIESPLLGSNNMVTCAVLLKFNGMISDCIYNILGVVPEYISSYDARKYSFPELMGIRKYARDGNPYDYEKIIYEIKHDKFVLFGGYSWEVDKKTIIQEKVANVFPNIEWLYDKNGELKKENFDTTDSYVCVLASMNQKRYGLLEFKTSNIVEINGSKNNTHPTKIEYDVEYWNKKEHRTTYID